MATEVEQKRTRITSKKQTPPSYITKVEGTASKKIKTGGVDGANVGGAGGAPRGTDGANVGGIGGASQTRPTMPSAELQSATILYAGGKIQKSIHKQAWRVFRTVGDRVDKPFPWKSDADAAFQDACAWIESASR